MMFKAKKKMASLASDSKAGRTVVLRILGKEGDAIVSTLKQAVTTWKDKPLAKAVKHDVMKLALKASMLWNHKDLNADNTKHLRRPTQIQAEMFLDICDRAPPGERRPDELVAGLAELRVALREVLAPHMKEKNAAMVDKVLDVYGNASFLTSFMNDDNQRESLETFRAALGRFMAPFPRVLDDETSLRASLEAASRALDLQSASLDTFLGESTLKNMFQEFLETHEAGAHKHALKFIHAEQDYRAITNRKIMPSRAENVFAKYLASSAKLRVNVGSAAIDEVGAAVRSGSANRAAFGPALKDVMAALEGAFAAFVATDACKKRIADAAEELAKLRARYGLEKWSRVDKVKAKRVMGC